MLRRRHCRSRTCHREHVKHVVCGLVRSESDLVHSACPPFLRPITGTLYHALAVLSTPWVQRPQGVRAKIFVFVCTANLTVRHAFLFTAERRAAISLCETQKRTFRDSEPALRRDGVRMRSCGGAQSISKAKRLWRGSNRKP